MQIIDGQLIERAKTRVLSDMAMGAAVAVKALRRGEVAHVRLHGLNVANVRSAVRESGVEVSE
jgi:hypothetical protein